MIDEILREAETKMKKSIEVAHEEFATIRTGRANIGMLNGITAEYYGTQTPLNQLASVQVPEARTMIITPFDKGAMHEIEAALRGSDLGVNPTNNGDYLRVILPDLTAERRKEYVKLAKTRAEDAKISVRAVRGTAKKQIESLVKQKETSEDDGARGEKNLETLTKKYTDQVDEALAAKETELTTL